MAVILRYFTDFVYDVVVKRLLSLPRFQNLLLIVYDHIIGNLYFHHTTVANEEEK